MRRKNSPPDGSEECWDEVMMFAPMSCRNPETALTMPGWSWHATSRRVITGSVAFASMGGGYSAVLWTSVRPMTGTFLNVGTIVVGATLGVALGGRIPDRTRSTITDVLGVFVLVLGISDALTAFGPALAAELGRAAVLVVIGSLLFGGLIGEWIDIERSLERLGAWLKDRVTRGTAPTGLDQDLRHPASAPPDPARARFVEGFVVTSLIVCVGPLAVLGALQDGLSGDYQLLAVKSLLDGSVALAFGSVLGFGVAFAALPLLIWQGGLTLAAGEIGAAITPPMIAALTAVGGVLVMGIGLRLLEVRAVRVANLLPALIVAPVIVALWP
jgi:uncharacterized membrane protein YqgA involved in biofilm formation